MIGTDSGLGEKLTDVSFISQFTSGFRHLSFFMPKCSNEQLNRGENRLQPVFPLLWSLFRSCCVSKAYTEFHNSAEGQCNGCSDCAGDIVFLIC